MRIASFNIEKIGTTNNYEAIAKIIEDNNFDIVAIQEVSKKESIKSLIQSLSKRYSVKDLGRTDSNSITNDSNGYETDKWEARWAKPNTFDSRRSEGYAFLWKKDTVALSENYLGKRYEPRIADYSEGSEIVRRPFLGRFIPKHGFYEIRLINVHISSTKISSSEMSNEEWRRHEFNALIDVYVKYNEKKRGDKQHDYLDNNRVFYTFALGDYNLNLSSSLGKDSGSYFRENQECIFKKSKDEMRIITVQDQLTTLSSKLDNYNELLDYNDDIYLSNNFDHFTYDENKMIKHNISQYKCGRINAFNDCISFLQSNDNKFTYYDSVVSDHLPVYFDFDIRDGIFISRGKEDDRVK